MQSGMKLMSLLLLFHFEAQSLRVPSAKSNDPESAAAAAATFVTVETRGEPKVAEFQSLFAPVSNLGKDKTWVNYKTKLEWVHDYVKQRPRSELVAFLDGSDVVYGGCSANDFLKSYQDIAASSGASIVFSAELVCGEQPCNKVPEVPSWAVERSGKPDLGEGYMRKFTNCERHRPRQPPKGEPVGELTKEGVNLTGVDWQWCSCQYGYDKIGIANMVNSCSNAMPMKFLNSGFYMGPAGDISDMMASALDDFDQLMGPNSELREDVKQQMTEQHVLAKYWLANPSKVTLDYTSELSQTTTRLRSDFFAVDDGDIINKVFRRRKQCFVHNNEYHEKWVKGWSDLGFGKKYAAKKNLDSQLSIDEH